MRRSRGKDRADRQGNNDDNETENLRQGVHGPAKTMLWHVLIWENEINPFMLYFGSPLRRKS